MQLAESCQRICTSSKEVLESKSTVSCTAGERKRQAANARVSSVKPTEDKAVDSAPQSQIASPVCPRLSLLCPRLSLTVMVPNACTAASAREPSSTYIVGVRVYAPHERALAAPARLRRCVNARHSAECHSSSSGGTNGSDNAEDRVMTLERSAFSW